MIDKTGKLQRYDRKDYTELVEFPVEIVGRDGVVRRYTFEDSIRLYQRRITFAPIRYRDMDLVRAEVGHCRSRIEQLRRSYFHRFGWGTPEGEEPVDGAFGDLAGELAAFLCRVLRCDGRPEIDFEPVNPTDALDTHTAPARTTWYVTPEGGAGMLLYVHRFEGAEADRVREAFFGQLKELERMSGRADGDTERLLAFHHTVDCGFILAGRGNELDDYSGQIPDEPSMDLSPTPYDEALELVRRGELEVATARCKEIVAEQPWHLSAYSLGAMLAHHLGDPWTTEELATIGSKYFPDDPTLPWYLGVARWVQGRLPEAETALNRALELAPDRLAVRGALVSLLLQQGRGAEAARLIAARPVADADDEALAQAMDQLAAWVRWRGVATGAGALLSLGGLASFGLVGPAAAVPLVAVGVGAAVVVHTLGKKRVEAWLARPPVEELGRAIKRLQRRAKARSRSS